AAVLLVLLRVALVAVFDEDGADLLLEEVDAAVVGQGGRREHGEGRDGETRGEAHGGNLRGGRTAGTGWAAGGGRGRQRGRAGGGRGAGGEGALGFVIRRAGRGGIQSVSRPGGGGGKNWPGGGGGGGPRRYGTPRRSPTRTRPDSDCRECPAPGRVSSGMWDI